MDIYTYVVERAKREGMQEAADLVRPHDPKLAARLMETVRARALAAERQMEEAAQ
jgi:hypothetical protein